MIRITLGIGLLLGAAVAFVVSASVPNPNELLFRGPFPTESLRGIPLAVTLEGRYLVQLEVLRTPGQAVDRPSRAPFTAEVKRGSSKIGEEYKSGWWGEQVSFAYYAFPGKPGDTLTLDVEPTKPPVAIGKHRLNLVVQREGHDYASFMFWQLAYLLLGWLTLALGLILLWTEWRVRRPKTTRGRVEFKGLG